MVNSSKCLLRILVDLSAARVPEQIPSFRILLTSELFIFESIKGNKLLLSHVSNSKKRKY